MSKKFWEDFFHDSTEEYNQKVEAYRNQKPVFLDFVEDKALFIEAAKGGFLQVDNEKKITAMLPHTPQELQLRLLDYLPKRDVCIQAGSRNINDFPHEAQSAGLIIDKFDTRPDKWHRCGVEGKKHGNKSGTYRIEDKGSHFFIVGLNFTTGQQVKFSTFERTKSIPARTNIALMLNADMYTQSRIEAERDIAKTRSEDARRMWKSLENARGNEPYAQNKQIHNLRLVKRLPTGELVVPLYNHEREMTSLQILSPDNKFLMKGGVKNGSFAVVGDVTDKPQHIIIGEGYATVDSALNLFKETTQSDNVMAFAAIDCHNMREVVMNLSEQYKHTQIYLALDNDKQGVRNAGIETGEFIVKSSPNIKCLVPDFGDERSCDWNDLFVENKQLARQQMQQQIFGRDQLKMDVAELAKEYHQSRQEQKAFEHAPKRETEHKRQDERQKVQHPPQKGSVR